MMPKQLENPGLLEPASLQVKSEMGGGAERRRTPRYPFTAAAEVVELRSQARVAGRSSDLSLGGCYIDVLTPFPVGSLVRVRLEREQKVFEAAAKVTYSLQSFGMGLAFSDVKPEHQGILRAWIAELGGDPLPPEAPPDPESSALATVLHLRQVFNELISLMVRKKLINEAEGAALLRQIFR